MKRKALILCYFSPIPTWKGTNMSLKYCHECHRGVEQIVLVCPDCKSEMFVHGKPSDASVKEHFAQNAEGKKSQRSQSYVNSQGGNSDPVFNDGLMPLAANFEDLIRAQNRTTHAVRAFVRFLFIQLTGITLAVFLWNISLAFIDEQACYEYGDKCTGNAFLQFMAGVVWLVAVILSSRAGWDELNKSNID